MKIKYYPIISLINGKKRDTLAEQFLDEIRAELGWELEAVDQIEDLKDEELRFIFVMSGGSESGFLKI